MIELAAGVEKMTRLLPENYKWDSRDCFWQLLQKEIVYVAMTVRLKI